MSNWVCRVSGRLDVVADNEEEAKQKASETSTLMWGWGDIEVDDV